MVVESYNNQFNISLIYIFNYFWKRKLWKMELDLTEGDI